MPPRPSKNNPPAPSPFSPGFRTTLLLLAIALSLLFHRSFQPGQILFANDGTLGLISCACNRMPAALTGGWQDINWLGNEAPSALPGGASPGLSSIFGTFFSPVGFMKSYGPFTLLFLGLCVWLFLRQLKFQPVVCLLAALAAALNMHFFSVACWGLGQWNIAIGLDFLALAALVTPSIRQPWAKAVLAGMAVGVNLMEGFDCGAILSLFIGAFALFQGFTQTTLPTPRRIAKAAATAALLILCSAWMGASIINTMVGTQIKGIVGAGQSAAEKKDHWNFATQWSLPKLETLRLFIPGFFGWRLTAYLDPANRDASYWGRLGEDPNITDLRGNDPALRDAAASALDASPADHESLRSNDPQLRALVIEKLAPKSPFRRHIAYGDYPGLLILLLAAFAIVITIRTATTVFSPDERRAVWFWTAAALFSLFAAWGRFSFLYAWLYQLPFFSTIRNPIKFLHALHVALIILAAFGMEALWRRHLKNAPRRANSLATHLKQWWPTASGLDESWAIASAIAAIVAIAAVAVLFGCKDALASFIQHQGFAADLSLLMVQNTLCETIWFAVLMVLSLALLLTIINGAWNGPRAPLAWILLAIVLVADLVHSDLPWLNYFDYNERYSPNQLTTFLKDHPWEHRVVARLSPVGPYDISGDTGIGNLVHGWLVNDFPFNDIQTLEIAQMPRMPALDATYIANFALHTTADLTPVGRLWKLTNTRYILADKKFLGLFNTQIDPTPGRPFQLLALYDYGRKPEATHVSDVGDLTVAPYDQGKIALIEYTNTLPRAKLFANWQTPESDAATLALLLTNTFDPARTVLISKDTPVPPGTGPSSADPGHVSITAYAPKQLTLHADANTPAILLLNDRTAPSWKATVDGQPVPVLRCNYIMRGVYIPAGPHTIQFRFQPPLTAFYITLSAWAFTLALAIFLLYRANRPDAPSGALKGS